MLRTFQMPLVKDQVDSFGNNIRMPNSLASDQIGCSVGPDLCPNYLQTSPARQQMTKLTISREKSLYPLPTGNLACFLSSADFVFKISFLEKILSGIP